MSETVTVVSLAPYPLGEAHHELGNLTIPARGKDERYAKRVYKDVITTKDFGEARKEPVTIKAKDIAEDVVGVYKEASLIPHGVFIAAGDEPTEQELKKAQKAMEAFYRAQIESADNAWLKNRRRREINQHAFVAADYFNLRKEWAIDMSEMKPCYACKELISPDAIKCPKCGAVHNLEAARKAGLVTAEMYNFMKGAEDTPVAEEVVKRGPGRPRKEA